MQAARPKSADAKQSVKVLKARLAAAHEASTKKKKNKKPKLSATVWPTSSTPIGSPTSTDRQLPFAEQIVEQEASTVAPEGTMLPQVDPQLGETIGYEVSQQKFGEEVTDPRCGLSVTLKMEDPSKRANAKTPEHVSIARQLGLHNILPEVDRAAAKRAFERSSAERKEFASKHAKQLAAKEKQQQARNQAAVRYWLGREHPLLEDDADDLEALPPGALSQRRRSSKKISATSALRQSSKISETSQLGSTSAGTLLEGSSRYATSPAHQHQHHPSTSGPLTSAAAAVDASGSRFRPDPAGARCSSFAAGGSQAGDGGARTLEGSDSTKTSHLWHSTSKELPKVERAQRWLDRASSKESPLGMPASEITSAADEVYGKRNK